MRENPSIDWTAFGASLASLLERMELAAFVNADALERLCALTEFLLAYNAHTNLTAITAPEQILTRHLADSLTLLPYLPQGASVADIGSGAGFPALPLAAVRPDLAVTAVESTGKKCAYMERAASEIGASNVAVVNARAEEAAFSAELREKFDIATARAVAELRILSELCLPFVRVGGAFLSMKSASSCERESAEAAAGICKLGGGVERSDFLEIPEGEETLRRAVIVIRKRTPTEKKFPRKYSQIARNPL